MTDYQICSNCVMDTTDPNISFNSDGVCDHCIDYYSQTLPNWHPNPYGNKVLSKIVDSIKSSPNSSPYNCILGLSGGLDSSYLLHQAVVEFGLKPLVFHVDCGWNTDLAVKNIEKLTSKLGLDLFTEIIEWDAVRDFQLALFKSGTPYLDLSQDHAFFATMYHYANKHNIKWILNGGNISTEGIRNPKTWLYYGTDMSFINDIRNKFCETDMRGYPWSSIYNHKIYLRYIKRIKVLRLLNYIPFDKTVAINLLSHEYGWTPYPQKHFESTFTKFYEGYWLPSRFGFDTRRVQFSSLIVTNQLSRDSALSQLERSVYDPIQLDIDKSFIADKLSISVDELMHYHAMPKKYYWDYKNQSSIFDFGAKVLKFIGAEFAIKR